ncbi:hypothetical protein JG688_00000382 [Phytophthora aleatoria]|uniref:Uncharacterized protein n=1 Tax=Phytophthora aleatoria TaxID=2496075 RepID=A0A8J5J8C0_9STRA|nr:hypothetical protein JG688_00000382 [Phytophthora aleatoria]
MAYAGEEATIVLSGIGTELSDGMLMNMYRTYGPIVRVRHNGTNSAQVVFAQKRHADKAVEATNGAVVYGKTLKVSLQRKFKKTTEPCRGFAAGICRKGDLCKYYHVTDEAAFASSAPVVAKAPREPKKKTPKPKAPKPAESAVVPSEVQGVPPTQLCRHFTRGFCAQGSACMFAHVLGVAKDAMPAPTGKVAQLCQFFLSGVCTRGNTCRFIHQTKADATPEKTATTKASVQSEEESESEAETEQNAETRTCVECEKPGVAVWKCAKCDNSLYCDDCNSAVHRARVMAKHKRTKLPPVPTLPRCGECESNTASVRCEQCEVPFCVSCDASVHKFKSLRKHTRVKLSSKAEKAQPTKKVQEEPKATKQVVKKGKTEAVESAPQAKVVDPVLYVESVPQLEFSSESSESEDEEMQLRTAQTTASDDEPMADASETESEDDFDDVKPQTSAPTPVVKEQAPVASESESEDESDDKPAAKPTPSPASGPKMELSSDSDSSDDEAPEPTPVSASTLDVDESSESEDESEDEPPSKPAVKPTPAPAPKPTLAELSSESESDSDSEVPSKPVVKQTKKLAPKAPAKSPVVKTKPAASSSSSDSSDSSEDEAPPAKPVKPTPAPRAPARTHKAGGISEGSSHTLVKKIEAFNESGEGNELHLDANLNGFERLLAHDCAERLGLAHESIGADLQRHIIISRHGAKRPAASSGHGHKAKKSKHRH